MRLNLGSGTHRLAGYTNVDLRAEVADVVADASNLNFAATASVEAILAEDLLEHFPISRTPQVLAEWFRVLQRGGTLTVKVPNLHALAVQIAARADDPDADATVAMLIENIYGGHRWGPDGSLDAHHTGWTPLLLHAELEAAGFTVISNDHAINMRVEAKKP